MFLSACTGGRENETRDANCANDITSSAALLQATILPCQTPFTFNRVHGKTNPRLPFLLVMEKLKNPRICITKLLTDKVTGDSSFFHRPLALSVFLMCLHHHGLMLPTFFHIFSKTSNARCSSAQCLLREQNILEGAVFGVTSALRGSPKTNINTVKLNATTWWSASFGLRRRVTQLSPSGEEPSVHLSATAQTH